MAAQVQVNEIRHPDPSYSTKEVNIRAPSTLDTKLAAPTFIKVLGATTKDMSIKADAHLVHRVAEVAIVTPTRR